MGELKIVPMCQVRADPNALRRVNRESKDYMMLVSRIMNDGFQGAITVRRKLTKNSAVYYQIIDGHARYEAARTVGLQQISVDVHELSDDQVLETQIMRSPHRVETKPTEYARQLNWILTRNPLMTMDKLSSKLGKSTTWLKKMLSLNKIVGNIQPLIDNGKIPLSSAYTLAKLPQKEQANWVYRARCMTPDQFIPTVQKRMREQDFHNKIR